MKDGVRCYPHPKICGKGRTAPAPGAEKEVEILPTSGALPLLAERERVGRREDERI